MSKNKQISLTYENIVLKVNEQQRQLSKINQNIQSKKEEELSFGERARKLQQQLAESMTLLEEQTSMAQ